MAKTKVNKSERIIFDDVNNHLAKWWDDYVNDRLSWDDEFDPKEWSEEQKSVAYYDNLNMWLDDEKMNLDKELDGVIIASADLGFWNGRRYGAKKFGTNLKNILDYCGCDYAKFYCDSHNVKGELIHHDGTHYLEYSLAPNNEVAEKILNLAAEGALTEEYVRRHTKSLRKYVADIFGW